MLHLTSSKGDQRNRHAQWAGWTLDDLFDFWGLHPAKRPSPDAAIEYDR